MDFSRTSVHQPFDGIKVFLGQLGHVGSFRHELAQETSRSHLIHADKGCAGPRNGFLALCVRQRLVMTELFPLAVGQRLTKALVNPSEGFAESFPVLKCAGAIQLDQRTIRLELSTKVPTAERLPEPMSRSPSQ